MVKLDQDARKLIAQMDVIREQLQDTLYFEENNPMGDEFTEEQEKLLEMMDDLGNIITNIQEEQGWID